MTKLNNSDLCEIIEIIQDRKQFIIECAVEFDRKGDTRSAKMNLDSLSHYDRLITGLRNMLD